MSSLCKMGEIRFRKIQTLHIFSKKDRLLRKWGKLESVQSISLDFTSALQTRARAILNFIKLALCSTKIHIMS